MILNITLYFLGMLTSVLILALVAYIIKKKQEKNKKEDKKNEM